MIESFMNMLGSIIMMLLKGTGYLAWGIGLLGIPLSIILIFANLKRGFKAVVLMLAALCLSVAVTLVLMPSSLVGLLVGVLQTHRIVIAGVLGLVAIAITGLVCFSKGDFPKLNLLFIKD